MISKPKQIAYYDRRARVLEKCINDMVSYITIYFTTIRTLYPLRAPYPNTKQTKIIYNIYYYISQYKYLSRRRNRWIDFILTHTITRDMHS